MDIPELITYDRKRADKTFAHHMAENDRDWIASASNLKDYQDSFKDILYPLTGHRNFDNIIYNWGLPRHDIVGVNFMGDTLPLAEMGISGLGCELVDNKRSNDLRDQDMKAGRTVIEGDLDTDATWEKIHAKLGNKKINIALWRSIGGVSTLPVLPHSIFRQIYKTDALLDRNHSLYLASLNCAASEYKSSSTPLLVQFMQTLTDAMNELEGIEAMCDYKVEQRYKVDEPLHLLTFGYTRSNNSPDLPIQAFKQRDPLLHEWIEMSEKYVPRI